MRLRRRPYDPVAWQAAPSYTFASLGE